MKQVLQNWKSGEITTAELPPPALSRRSGVLVRNVVSLISAGTERTSVAFAQSSLIDKAREKPDEVKKLLKDVRDQGFWNVYERVQRKMDVPVPRGYSCAGVVIAVSTDVDDLHPGDRVACGGQGAYHAGVVSVKRNLCAKIQDGVTFDEAAYTTLGAIAMQGVRMAMPTIGETIVVIGLGLVGQLAAQIAKANGCTVIGVDLAEFNCAIARTGGIDLAFARSDRSDRSVLSAVLAATDGHGADAVIICAATESNDPIELAAQLCRQRGRVVLVGVSKIDLPRQVFYDKELAFTVSRSYGPGRYDVSYEEHGVDYPIGYVRWTERRNMQAFLKLAAQKKLVLAPLTSHRFAVDHADNAYALLQQKEQPSVGILIDYPSDPSDPSDHGTSPITVNAKTSAVPAVTVGFIGAGAFAQTHLLPHLHRSTTVKLVGVCNAHGSSADVAVKQFGFSYLCTDDQRILNDADINTVFIAARHDLHASTAMAALNAGKNVFVEKPLALNEAELTQLISAQSASKGILLVGFNRRFSPAVNVVKQFLADVREPKVVEYRVNAGFIAKDHWAQDPDEGGGRIVGEVCHFIDTIQYLTDAQPVSVFAQCIGGTQDTKTNADNVAITISMSDGSVGVITYLANGDRSVPKENIVVSGGGKTAVMNNFQSVELHFGGKSWVKKLGAVDKGQRAEVEAFVQAIVRGEPSPIVFASLVDTTRATFAVLSSLAIGESVRL